MNKTLTDEQILTAFRDAGIDLNATPNMVYTVRGQQAQLVNAVRAILAARQPEPRAEVTDAAIAAVDAVLKANAVFFGRRKLKEIVDAARAGGAS